MNLLYVNIHFYHNWDRGENIFCRTEDYKLLGRLSACNCLQVKGFSIAHENQ